MIRIPVTEAELVALIAAHDGRWLEKARQRTAEYRGQGHYLEGREFWGDIKQVYIELQHEKCAYCESRLAGRALASKVHEVEHFRPKSKVGAWPPATGRGAVGFIPPCPVGRPSTRGYYLLAYHPLNYVIACTRCNSTLKADYFPVRGRRRTRASTPQSARSEDPLLVYPLGTLDTDPARIIRFDGVLAVPRRKRGRDHERARVTIEFFQLNHQDLTSRRARLLGALWLALRALQLPGVPDDLRQLQQQSIAQAQSDQAEFAACARDFIVLHGSDRERADVLGGMALQLAVG
ncbi:hypothetical protein [Stenotrophomonas sp. CFBP8980]|jgi:hypothetical protein|uniref:hypothetical protein n=1 Tax=Stenotrophomonas sp. CFBP8980 TaxID=3096523 RepID=UPI0005AF380E|nr:hypothetical protein [Stenotrophomonas sp. CFBP8980]KIP86031.1 hypothetical protein SN15_09805 [Stenotrophomonas maltophilia]MDY1034365.1 hypothetical protein [Stenotrophomonas sp. CFBP8980]